MKTLVFSAKAAERGGIEIFAERQVATMREAGRDVVFADAPPADLSAYGEIFVHKCPDVAVLERFPPDKTTLYVHDHDAICPRSYAYTPLCRNCRRRSGILPCIFCAPLCKHPRAALGRVLSQSRRKAAMAKARRIVVLSEFMKGRLVANGIPAEKISVEPPAIHAPASAAGKPDVDMLFAGQLIRGKGLQLLLRAMARMETPRTLDVVGTGNMEARLKALAARLGVAGRVRWHGYRQDVGDWMRAASCVVVPSFWQEPYGLVAAEAVALGRPVVAFAIGGLPEACAGGSAVLVPPGDVAALARALDGKAHGVPRNPRHPRNPRNPRSPRSPGRVSAAPAASKNSAPSA